MEMEAHVINRGRILKNLESCDDVSSSNVTLICSNGKFKVNTILVAGIYYLFEQILSKLSDEGPRPTVLTFPDIKTEDLESSFLSLYQQLYEEPTCVKWQKLLKSNDKLNEVAMNDLKNEMSEDGENYILDDKMGTSEDPVKIQILKKPKTIKPKLPRYYNGDQKVPCELCGKQVRKRYMKTHLEFVHKQNMEKIEARRKKVPCEQCGKEVSVASMGSHLASHSGVKMATCSMCGKQIQVVNLEKHLTIIHGIGEPKFPCHVCGKKFMNRHQLKDHLYSHEEKKPCTICGALVKRLEMHMREAHMPNEEKKHKCPECGKGFYQTNKLAQHRINVHLRNRPFPCRYGCDFRYNDSSNRNSHERKKHGGLFNKQTASPESVIPTK